MRENSYRELVEKSCAGISYSLAKKLLTETWYRSVGQRSCQGISYGIYGHLIQKGLEITDTCHKDLDEGKAKGSLAEGLLQISHRSPEASIKILSGRSCRQSFAEIFTNETCRIYPDVLCNTVWGLLPR